jgi:hypothetical protein
MQRVAEKDTRNIPKIRNSAVRKPQTSAPANGMAFAFNQGIPRDAVLSLLGGTHTKSDRAMYYRCAWWLAKRGETLQAFGCQCAMCGSMAHLQVHHKPSGYRRLFREKPIIDLTVACRN